MYINTWRYVNDFMQSLINKESYWLTLTILCPEARPKSHDISLFCIEKCKQLEILVPSKATVQRM